MYNLVHARSAVRNLVQIGFLVATHTLQDFVNCIIKEISGKLLVFYTVAIPMVHDAGVFLVS